jgi:hypothetical protein
MKPLGSRLTKSAGIKSELRIAFGHTCNLQIGVFALAAKAFNAAGNSRAAKPTRSEFIRRAAIVQFETVGFLPVTVPPWYLLCFEAASRIVTLATSFFPRSAWQLAYRRLSERQWPHWQRRTLTVGSLPFRQRSLRISDELPVRTGKPWPSVLTLAGSVRAQSGGLLYRDALQQHGVRVRRDRGTLQLVDASLLAYLVSRTTDLILACDSSFQNRFLQTMHLSLSSASHPKSARP